MPKLGDGSRSKLRYQIAALCFAAAIVMMFLAYRFDTRDFLISTPLHQRSGPEYSRMWFDNRDVLAGAVQHGAKLKIERWSGGPSSVETWDADLVAAAAAPQNDGDPKWTVAGDFARIAWISS